MGGLFTALFGKISALAGWFGDLFKAAFTALWDLVKDAVCWTVDQFLGIAVSAAQGIDTSAVSSWASVWGSVPANVLEVCAALGLGTAFGIIAAAIGIRLVLQLIPFTRLGS